MRIAESMARMLEEPHWMNEEPNLLLINSIESVNLIIIEAAAIRLPHSECFSKADLKYVPQSASQ